MYISSSVTDYVNVTANVLERICTSTGSTISDKHRQAILKFAQPIALLMPEYGINTTLRQAHFLSQVIHESGELLYTEENLRYTASRLMEVFPKYFRSITDARRAAGDPDLTASIVYANRYGNGGRDTHDGYTFRGRGLIQLTFRSNYQRFLEHLRTLPSSSLPAIPRSLGFSRGLPTPPTNKAASPQRARRLHHYIPTLRTPYPADHPRE